MLLIFSDGMKWPSMIRFIYVLFIRCVKRLILHIGLDLWKCRLCAAALPAKPLGSAAIIFQKKKDFRRVSEFI